MLYVFNLSDVKQIVMTITVNGESFEKTFNATDCSGATISIDVSRYVQEFTFVADDVYRSTCRQDSSPIDISYAVSFVATYTNDTTATLSYTDYSIPSL
jgi:hypothetical protein